MSKRDKELSWIYRIAQEAVSVFEQHGLPCCLIGSAAAELWCYKPFGRDYYRVPDDIDLVVMAANADAEDLKRLLAAHGSGFTLDNAWDPTKTYKIVKYNAEPPLIEMPSGWKLDILVPGDLDIPLIPEARFIHLSMRLPDATYTLPCMPLLPLLILKLHGWCNIRNDKQCKDVRKLLHLAEHSGVTWASFQRLPAEFIQKAQKWASDFVCTYPESQGKWRRIGFVQMMEEPQLAISGPEPQTKRQKRRNAFQKVGKV